MDALKILHGDIVQKPACLVNNPMDLQVQRGTSSRRFQQCRQGHTVRGRCMGDGVHQQQRRPHDRIQAMRPSAGLQDGIVMARRVFAGQLLPGPTVSACLSHASFGCAAYSWQYPQHGRRLSHFFFRALQFSHTRAARHKASSAAMMEPVVSAGVRVYQACRGL